MTAMITANGSELATPGVDAYRVSSACPMPIATPAAKAIGNDRKLATRAAAIAASTRFVIVETCNVTIGDTRIAARPASPDPSAQLTVAMRSGDSPTDDAARWFSATAEVDDAELRVAVERPQSEAQNGGDAEQDEPVDRHRLTRRDGRASSATRSRRT